MSVNSTSPQTLFGGTWEQIKDKFLLSAGSTYTNGSTGGEATHKLTTSEMPKHSHNVKVNGINVVMNVSTSGSTNGLSVTGGGYFDGNTNILYANDEGSSTAHNNMPPYLVVYVWKRTK